MKKLIAMALLALMLLAGCTAEDGPAEESPAGGESSAAKVTMSLYPSETRATAQFPLPNGWSVVTENLDRAELRDANGKVAAEVTFSSYTAHPDLPRDEEWKVVYSSLRLSSMVTLARYTPVSITDSGESALADYSYKDPDYLAAHPETANSEVPFVTVPMVLCYNRELAGSVTIAFAPETGLSDDEIHAIAEGIRLLPAEEPASKIDLAQVEGSVHAQEDFVFLQYSNSAPAPADETEERE